MIDHENDFDKYKNDTDEILAVVSKEGHGHVITDVADLQEALDSKMSKDEANETDESLRAHINEEIIKAKAYTDELISNVIGDTNDKGITSIEGVVDALVEHENEFSEYKTNIDLALAGKSPEEHVHDDRYSPLGHKHKTDDINGFNTALEDCKSSAITEATSQANEYTEKKVAEIINSETEGGLSLTKLANDLSTHISTFNSYKDSTDSTLATKSDIGHSHIITDITDLQSALDAKLSKDEAATNDSNLRTFINEEITKVQSDVNKKISDIIGEENEKNVDSIKGVVDIFIEHENVFNTYKTNTDLALAGKSDIGHPHVITDVANLQNILDSKIDKDEVNTSNNNLKLYIDEEIIKAKAHADGIKSELLGEENDKGITSIGAAVNALIEHENEFNEYKSDINDILATVSKEGHGHDDKYSPLGHKHETRDINGFNTALEDCKSSAISEAVSSSNAYTENKVSEILGTDTETDLNLTKIANDLSAHINVFNSYKESTDSTLATVSKEGHIHVITDITNLQGILDSKMNKDEAVENNNNLKSYVDEEIIKAKAHADEKMSEVVGEENEKGIETIKEIVDVFVAYENEFDEFKEETDLALASKSPGDHVHDDKYSPLDHKHTTEDITNITTVLDDYKSSAISEAVSSANTYTENRVSEILGTDTETDLNLTKLANDLSTHINTFNSYKESTDSTLATVSKEGHTHVISNITNLQETLDSKANTVDVNKNLTDTRNEITTEYQAYVSTSISNLVDSAPEAMNTLNELATAINAHQDVYDAYVETVSKALALKSDEGHGHVIADTTGLQETLNSKLNKDEAATNDSNLREYVNEEIIGAKKYTDEEIAAVIGEQNDKNIETIKGVVDALIEHENDFAKYKLDIDDALADKSVEGHTHIAAEVTMEDTELNDMLIQIYGFSAQEK